MAIQDLVQKKVTENLWQKLGEKMTFYQSEINQMSTYTIQHRYLQEKISMHLKHLHNLSFQAEFSSPSSGKRDMEKYKQSSEHLCLLWKQREIEDK